MKPYPQVNVPFELTLDGDLPENTLMGIVEAFGYKPAGWDYNGTVLTGKQTRQFMLVGIGYQPNLAEAKKVLEAKYGPTPEGQFMKAFKDEYEANGINPVGVADDSWVDPLGRARFPFVNSDGEPDFYWTARDLDGHRLWLVFAPAPGK